MVTLWAGVVLKMGYDDRKIIKLSVKAMETTGWCSAGAVDSMAECRSAKAFGLTRALRHRLALLFHGAPHPHVKATTCNEA